MQDIEKTLRDTLSKLKTPDYATRLKLYNATQTMLEQSLEPFVQSEPDMVSRHRAQFSQIIKTLETEFGGAELTRFDQKTEPKVEPEIDPLPTDIKSEYVPVVELPQSPQTSQVDQTSRPDKLENLIPEKLSSIANTSITDISGTKAVKSDNLPLIPDVAAEPRLKGIEKTSIEQPHQVDQSKQSDQSNDPSNAQPVTTARPIKNKAIFNNHIFKKPTSAIILLVLTVSLISGAWLLTGKNNYVLPHNVENNNIGQQQSDQAERADESFIPKSLNSYAEQSHNWITIFDARDTDKIGKRGNVLIEKTGDDKIMAAQITSINAKTYGEALIPLDTDKLDAATGQKLSLIMSMWASEQTEIYIRCLLKEGMEFSRQRFQLKSGHNDILVSLDTTDVIQFQAQPFIAVNSDITGSGKTVKLYHIKYQLKNQDQNL